MAEKLCLVLAMTPSACLLQVSLTAVSVSQTCTDVTEIKPIFMNCQALKLFVGECIIPQQPVFVAGEFGKKNTT